MPPTKLRSISGEELAECWEQHFRDALKNLTAREDFQITAEEFPKAATEWAGSVADAAIEEMMKRRALLPSSTEDKGYVE